MGEGYGKHIGGRFVQMLEVASDEIWVSVT